MHIRPMNDVAFHFVFGRNVRKRNLINLLNAILSETGQAPILDLAVQETQFDPKLVAMKNCRLDLQAQTIDNRLINVEVQVSNQANMEKRSLFYWGKLFASQLKAGQDYLELRKTIAINILDFPYLGNGKVHSVYKLFELNTFNPLTDVLEIHFLELPRLHCVDPDLTCPLTRWLLFLSDQTTPRLREEIIMLDKNIQSASEDLSRLVLDEHARRAYELREKALLDERSNLRAARNAGLQEGLKKGQEKGIQEGTRRLAKAMLLKGLDKDLIREIAGLNQEEIAILLED